jgi:hypothetical protein
MKATKFWFNLLIMGFMLTFIGCNDDVETQPDLEIESIVATGADLETGENVDVDLNSATSAEDVPLAPEINVTFSREVDAATTNNTNFALSSADGAVPMNVSANGAVVTLTPQEELARGTDYTLTVSDAVAAQDGGAFTSVTRSFTSAGRAAVTPPQESGQIAYWSLDGNANASVESFNADEEIEITYGEDRFGQAGSAAYFNGDASLIEIPNGDELLTDNWTNSFWVQVDTVDHLDANGNNAGHFVMGVGAFFGFQIEIPGNADFMKMAARYQSADGTTIGSDFFVNGDGMDASNGGWEAIEYEENIPGGMKTVLAQKWTHVVITYDAGSNTRSLYLNGQLIERDNLDTAGLDLTGLTFDPSGTDDVIGNKLALGFAFDRSTTLWSNEPWGNYESPTANHFKGALDDIRFFNTALTESEVQTLYNAEQ